MVSALRPEACLVRPVGGRQVWEPASPVEVTDRWLDAAEAEGASS
ncbi:hypothetical protein [Kitasatospora sp. NPDC050467]